MGLQVKKATKKQAKLKMCLVGPSGSGKTYTSLQFARELAGQDGRILVLDSEKGSASLYSDIFPFDVIELWSRDEQRQPIRDPFHYTKYMEAIQIAEDEGYAVLVIDSLSHVWNDAGGFLDLVSRVAAQKYKNNTYAAWNDVTPLYRKFVDAITDARIHIIATMRSKTDTSQEKDEKGKTVIKKLGTSAVQKEGLEYEFTLYCNMDIDNTISVEKTRFRDLKGDITNAPTGTWLHSTIEWLNRGAPDERPIVQEQPFVHETMPAPSEIDSARTDWARAYNIAENEIDARWERYKKYILSRVVSDPDVTISDLNLLKDAIQAQLDKVA